MSLKKEMECNEEISGIIAKSLKSAMTENAIAP